MRLFVALPVPSSFADIADSLPRKYLSRRWTQPEDYHITLRFLGETEASRLADIHQALQKIRRAPFGITIEGLGVFENRHKIILYAKVASIRKITSLCCDISDSLIPLGFDFGVKPYIPHITLARCDSVKQARQFAMRYHARIHAQWTAEAFCLMESSIINTGTSGRYRIQETYRLDG